MGGGGNWFSRAFSFDWNKSANAWLGIPMPKEEYPTANPVQASADIGNLSQTTVDEISRQRLLRKSIYLSQGTTGLGNVGRQVLS